MELLQELSSLADPRDKKRISYPLPDLIFMSVCAVLGGAYCWQDIHDFVCFHKKWFGKFVCLKKGIPSHDTFRRLFMLVSHKEIEKVFSTWAQSITQMPSKQIVVDGKALGGTSRPNSGLSCLNFVSAWCYENGIVLSQIATKAKSNEIKAIPELLDHLVIKGSLISIDAAGCQKEIVKKISSKGADYLIALKGNQRALYEFSKAHMADKLHNGNKIYDKFDDSHGRSVRRRVFVAEAHPGFQKMGWTNIASIAAVETISKLNSDDHISCEWRYYISSKPHTDPEIHNYIRNHWSIENNLHWILDVHMGDDANRSQERNSTLAMAALKRVAVNIIKTQDAQNKSIRRKLKQASWDITYLEELIIKTA
jgi:predicted transposase YbfD/YdcC